MNVFGTVLGVIIAITCVFSIAIMGESLLKDFFKWLSKRKADKPKVDLTYPPVPGERAIEVWKQKEGNKSTCKFKDLPQGTLFSDGLYYFIKIEEVTDATGYHGNSVTAKGNVVWINDDVDVKVIEQ